MKLDENRSSSTKQGRRQMRLTLRTATRCCTISINLHRIRRSRLLRGAWLRCGTWGVPSGRRVRAADRPSWPAAVSDATEPSLGGASPRAGAGSARRDGSPLYRL